MEGDGVGDRVARDVHEAGIGGRTAGGLEEGGDEPAVGGNEAEVGPGEVFEEDVVAEDVGEVRGGRGRRGVVVG